MKMIVGGLPKHAMLGAADADLPVGALIAFWICKALACMNDPRPTHEFCMAHRFGFIPLDVGAVRASNAPKMVSRSLLGISVNRTCNRDGCSAVDVIASVLVSPTMNRPRISDKILEPGGKLFA